MKRSNKTGNCQLTGAGLAVCLGLVLSSEVALATDVDFFDTHVGLGCVIDRFSNDEVKQLAEDGRASCVDQLVVACMGECDEHETYFEGRHSFVEQCRERLRDAAIVRCETAEIVKADAVLQD